MKQTDIKQQDWESALKLNRGLQNNDKVSINGNMFWGPYYAPGELAKLAVALISQISDSELVLGMPVGVSNIHMNQNSICVRGEHEIIDKIEANIFTAQSSPKLNRLF
jgi:hypothetical protein